MAVYKQRRLLKIVSLALLGLMWIISATSLAQGQTLYEYIDKDGSVIITDSPPPGAKMKRMDTLSPPATEEQKAAAEKESSEKAEKYREADAQRKDKEESIRVAKEELEKAKRDEELYRSNMNQASGYSQRHHWRVLVDEQQKLIEEKQKKVDELESGLTQ